MVELTAPRRILTRNRMGWSSDQLSPLSLSFVEFSRTCSAPVLDIGAGLGAAALAALGAGASVIANDLDDGALKLLSERVLVRPGRFPREVHFEPAKLGAVHASNVFHFLTGNQLEYGFRAIARWLQPGGRLFVQAATPYQAPFAAFLPEYRRRLAAGEKWPGWIPKISLYSSHRQLSQMPRSLHLLDDAILTRTALAAGLEIERAWLFRRADLPATLHLDGRESVALIARKPSL
ncbi:MAG TPA: class I SAM-dependent methyltransferase [Paludibaculum sp.]